MSIKKPATQLRRTVGRIYELDLLRGFFILVILIDHFQRWPSFFSYISGEGKLWASAAEGFFLISGLLIGYLRGWKGRQQPLKNIARKLFARAAMLYVWCIGITFFVVSLMTFFTIGTDSLYALLPKFPNSQQVATLPIYVWNIISGQYVSDWIYFLRLYAIMLIVSPIVIWLLRKGRWWVVLLLSITAYAASFLQAVPESALQWQTLFFGAVLIGWKLEAITGWLTAHPVTRVRIAMTLFSITVISMILSYFLVLGWSNVEGPHAIISRDSYIAIRAFIDPWFTNNPMAVGRIVLSFIWFGGLFSAFHYGRKFIMNWFGWLLLPFGTASLSVYCLQALLFVFLEAAIPTSQSYIINTLSTTLVVLLVWWIVRTPCAQRILPR